MTCSLCLKEIVSSDVMITLDVGFADLRGETRYTGIAWHVTCAPAHREHLQSEASALFRDRSAAAN